MRENVRFTIGQNTFDLSDYHLKVESYEIGISEVKTAYLEIPYSNVFYDFTQYFGVPTYKQRDVKIECKLMKSTPCWQKIMKEVLNLMHGQSCTFTFASDSEWSYSGRISVETNEHEAWNYATVSFTIKCAPFKTNQQGETSL